MKSLLFSLLFAVAALAMPLHILAASYGEGNYGEGSYNIGEVPPSPTPGSSSSHSSGSSSGSSGSSASSSNPSCTDEKPASAPDLFQINANVDSLTLYFSPVAGSHDRYFVSYSTSDIAEEHGYEFMDSSNGVVFVDISHLQKNTAYYVKVRAGNGCQPGGWSNILAARTGQRFPSYRWSSLPRIVSTGIAQRVNPSSVQRINMDASTIETPKQETSTPEPVQPQTPPPQESPSLLNRITDFFKGLFGR